MRPRLRAKRCKSCAEFWQMRFALVTTARGFARPETLRAYTEEEYRKIVAALT